MARVLAERLGQQLGQPVVIENNGTAAGIVAARTVARAEPDGYTLLFVGPGFASVPSLHKQPPYEPVKDFAAVSLVTRFPQLLVIKPAVPAKNVSELIALAKAEPGKLTFGSSGVGGAAHIPAEMFMHLAGVTMTHVPFRGGGPASAALLGGQIDILFDGIAPQQGNIASNFVAGARRDDQRAFAIVAGRPGGRETARLSVSTSTGLFAAARTPKAMIDRLAVEIGKAMRDSVVMTALRRRQGRSDRLDGRRVRRFFREQLKFNEDVIKRANIQLE